MPADVGGTLPLTGERTVPGIPAENYWLRRHEAAYEFARTRVHGDVVEVGCGEGYGTTMLAGAARSIIGVDYDAATVAHAARTYPAASFVRGNLAALPLAGGCADVLATLQVVEHVWDHPQFVRECLRVLRPGGLLLITTPNRLTFSPGLDAPLNPFHTREFTAAELSELLRSCGFAVSWVGGLHAGPRIEWFDAAHGGSFADAQIATPPDRWDAGLRADVASISTADFQVLADGDRDVDGALDLVLLARPGR